MSKNYKHHLSDFQHWPQRDHSQDWILYGKNLSTKICIDEVALSKGELYTVVSNAQASCQKGSLIAMVKGTKTEQVIAVLEKIPVSDRGQVLEVSVDLAANMEKIALLAFNKASVVSDRFHVQQLCSQAVQQVRIKHRWKAIDEQNQAAKKAKQNNKKYYPEVLQNGDTRKQLLARSRYLLFKTSNKWTPTQQQRAKILFELYPDIQEAYQLSITFRNIYQLAKNRAQAKECFDVWINKVNEKQLEVFDTVAESIQHHYNTILNYFVNRTTNALAEALNSKIKAFRTQFRGVKDIPFFLFRLAKILA